MSHVSSGSCSFCSIFEIFNESVVAVSASVGMDTYLIVQDLLTKCNGDVD